MDGKISFANAAISSSLHGRSFFLSVDRKIGFHGACLPHVTTRTCKTHAQHAADNLSRWDYSEGNLAALLQIIVSFIDSLHSLLLTLWYYADFF